MTGAASGKGLVDVDDHTVTGRVVAILEALADVPSSSPVALAELTARTSIPKPTVRRIANDLVARRLVRREDRGYLLGPRMVSLGGAAEWQTGLAERVIPFVHDLHARTGMIAWAGRVDGTTLTMLDRVHGREHTALLATEWPVRLDAFAVPSTAVAQLIVSRDPHALDSVLTAGVPRVTRHTVVMPGRIRARLRRVSATGVAVEWEECRLGWWCAAAEVAASGQRLVLGVTGPTSGSVPTRVLADLGRICREVTREAEAAGSEAALGQLPRPR